MCVSAHPREICPFLFFLLLHLLLAMSLSPLSTASCYPVFTIFPLRISSLSSCKCNASNRTSPVYRRILKRKEWKGNSCFRRPMFCEMRNSADSMKRGHIMVHTENWPSYRQETVGMRISNDSVSLLVPRFPSKSGLIHKHTVKHTVNGGRPSDAEHESSHDHSDVFQKFKQPI
jgi:hypothetical protein